MCIKKVEVKCWLAEMILVTMSLPLACIFQCLFTSVLVSASHWLAEISQLTWQGATGELDVEFKFQRRSCKLSFFSCPTTGAPGRACSQANRSASFLTPVIFTLVLLYADGTPCLILLDCKLCINCIHETTRKGWHHHQLTIFLSKYKYENNFPILILICAMFTPHLKHF